MSEDCAEFDKSQSLTDIWLRVPRKGTFLWTDELS
jgi:hypothetical protein